MKQLFLLSLFALIAVGMTSELRAQSGPLAYFTMTPCRVIDTRWATGQYGGPSFSGGTQRNFRMRGQCGIPTTAQALSINITITNATSGGSWLAVWPFENPPGPPGTSTINFSWTEPALANGAIVAMGVDNGGSDLSIYNADGNVNVIVDVTGYSD